MYKSKIDNVLLSSNHVINRQMVVYYGLQMKQLFFFVRWVSFRNSNENQILVVADVSFACKVTRK